jgi:hypothetical protein
MKNIIKTVGIIAFVAVLGLGLFTSCEEPEEASLTVGNGAKTSLTITGLTSYNGKFASGGIADTVTEDMYVFIPTTITNGSVTVNILNEKASAVSLDGTGHIVLFIDETNKQDDFGKTYTGVAYSKTIRPGANNNIVFTDFVERK